MMKTPTDVLRAEHTLILRGLDLRAAAPGRVEGGAAPPDGWWEEVLGWLRAFADRNHHAKEEDLLFPAMIKAGVPSEGGPINVMLEEHEQGRALIRAMAESRGAARAARAREYVALLRAHIDKENGVLFPLADAVLADDEQRALGSAFATVESELGRGASVSYAEAVVEGFGATLGEQRLVAAARAAG
jgi:hemerythrin-like domain-containing protein